MLLGNYAQPLSDNWKFVAVIIILFLSVLVCMCVCVCVCVLKDEKFGYGGKRNGKRKNDASSSADMSSFKPHKHSPRLSSSASKKRKNRKGRVTKRLGKAKRDKMKQGRKK